VSGGQEIAAARTAGASNRAAERPFVRRPPWSRDDTRLDPGALVRSAVPWEPTLGRPYRRLWDPPSTGSRTVNRPIDVVTRSVNFAHMILEQTAASRLQLRRDPEKEIPGLHAPTGDGRLLRPINEGGPLDG
jgi:hypothetical protein